VDTTRDTTGLDPVTVGKAQGDARDYQVECLDLLVREAGGEGLLPCAGDGIDVPIRLGVPTVRFDVALRDASGRLVVAECKRWRIQDRVKQANIGSFAYNVERLRAVSGVEVAAFYFTTSDYQLGALKTALEPGVTVSVFHAGQTWAGLTYAFQRYDPEREARVRSVRIHLPAATLVTSATLTGVVIRGDGTRQDLGELR
jgi:hypothetical protein